MMQKLKTVLSRPRVRAGVAATVAVAAVAAAAMVGVHVGRGEGREHDGGVNGQVLVNNSRVVPGEEEKQRCN